MTVKRSMPPAGSSDARLLILGSLPGDASLAARRYYAHPRNQFWRLLGHAIGEKLAEVPYDHRLQILAAHDIALWDVVAQATRLGSLDGSIRSPAPNPLRSFVVSHPRLRVIAFNGQTAARLGRAALGEVGHLHLIDLPSSSPAYTLPVDRKAELWATLRRLHGGQKLPHCES